MSDTKYQVWIYNGRHEWTLTPGAKAMSQEGAERLAAAVCGSLAPGRYLAAVAFPVGINPND